MDRPQLICAHFCKPETLVSATHWAHAIGQLAPPNAHRRGILSSEATGFGMHPCVLFNFSYY